MATEEIRFRIEVKSHQKAVALRDKLRDLLAEDKDVQIISESATKVHETFDVIGYDTKKGERVHKIVEADDEEAATTTVESKTVMVLDVRRAM